MVFWIYFTLWYWTQCETYRGWETNPPRGIRNLTKKSWTATFPNGTMKEIAPQRAAPLKLGLKLNIEGIDAEILKWIIAFQKNQSSNMSGFGYEVSVTKPDRFFIVWTMLGILMSNGDILKSDYCIMWGKTTNKYLILFGLFLVSPFVVLISGLNCDFCD